MSTELLKVRRQEEAHCKQNEVRESSREVRVPWEE